jgi:hypothetical protein
MSGVLALSWLEHRRTSELCAGLDIELLVLTRMLRGPLPHLALGARTLALLARHRVDVLRVQSPSLILASLAAALRRVLGYRRLGRVQLEVEAERRRVELAERWSGSAHDLVGAVGDRAARFSVGVDEVKFGAALRRMPETYLTVDDER